MEPFRCALMAGCHSPSTSASGRRRRPFFHPVAGAVKDAFGTFSPIFVLVGLLPFLGLGALVFGWGFAAEEAKPV